MIFLDLGYQPFANEYLIQKKKKEKKYRLLIDFNKKNKIVSIKKKFLSKEIFKNNYPYRSSISKTMQKSFKDLAQKIKKNLIVIKFWKLVVMMVFFLKISIKKKL